MLSFLTISAPEKAMQKVKKCSTNVPSPLYGELCKNPFITALRNQMNCAFSDGSWTAQSFSNSVFIED